jgi:hypothetical protein
MASKAVISLATGMEDPEKVTVAFLVAVGAAETGRETLVFMTKDAVRLDLRAPRSASLAMDARRSRTCSSASTRPAGATTSARSASTLGSSTPTR